MSGLTEDTTHTFDIYIKIAKMKDVKVGTKIKELRLRFGVSQDELAEKSQLSLRTIQRIENGETVPRGDSLKRLSNALNVNIEQFTNDTFDNPLEPELKADNNIVLLLNFSTLGFLIFPLLGIVFPWIVWIVYKDKIDTVKEKGRKIMKLQISWCLILFAVYLYVIGLKFFKFLHLPEPQNQKFFVILIATLYVFNALVILISTLTCFQFKKGIQRIAMN